MKTTTNMILGRPFKLMALLIFTAGILFLYSCGNDDDPMPENEEELITTLTMTFSNVVETSDVVVAQYRDIDGDGGMAPEIIHPTLKANAIYNAEIVVLNESMTPSEDITEEIIEEGEEHQFFFGSSNTSLLSFSYLDTDANGQPIGVSTRWNTNDAGNGSFVVILRHMPDKDAAGVSEGDITNAGGETDIEVTFDLTIE